MLASIGLGAVRLLALGQLPEAIPGGDEYRLACRSDPAGVYACESGDVDDAEDDGVWGAFPAACGSTGNDPIAAQWRDGTLVVQFEPASLILIGLFAQGLRRRRACGSGSVPRAGFGGANTRRRTTKV
jgi:hypothetical protein